MKHIILTLAALLLAPLAALDAGEIKVPFQQQPLAPAAITQFDGFAVQRLLVFKPVK